MTGKKHGNTKSVRLLVTLLLCILANYCTSALPEPFPSNGEDITDDAENLLLIKKVKHLLKHKHEVMEEEKDLAEEQLEIRAMLEKKMIGQRLDHIISEFSDEDSEVLPEPSAVIHNTPLHSGKRTNYMTLCHFKICNMGRKRQLQN